MTIRIFNLTPIELKKDWHYHAKAYMHKKDGGSSSSKTPWAFSWHTARHEITEHHITVTPYCDFGYGEEKLVDKLKDLASAYYYGVTVEELYSNDD